jgi:Fur family ferric uptake transcriptional regulator
MTDVIRPTRQRQVVTEALSELDQFRSAQDLHTLLTERGETVGLATVYRTLQLLAEAEIVDVVRSDAGESLYRQCSTGHHHHLVCRACGRTIEIEGPAVERWADRVANEHGYTDVSHTLEIFGNCASCCT